MFQRSCLTFNADDVVDLRLSLDDPIVRFVRAGIAPERSLLPVLELPRTEPVGQGRERRISKERVASLVDRDERPVRVPYVIGARTMTTTFSSLTTSVWPSGADPRIASTAPSASTSALIAVASSSVTETVLCPSRSICILVRLRLPQPRRSTARGLLRATLSADARRAPARTWTHSRRSAPRADGAQLLGLILIAPALRGLVGPAEVDDAPVRPAGREKMPLKPRPCRDSSCVPSESTPKTIAPASHQRATMAGPEPVITAHAGTYPPHSRRPRSSCATGGRWSSAVTSSRSGSRAPRSISSDEHAAPFGPEGTAEEEC